MRAAETPPAARVCATVTGRAFRAHRRCATGELPFQDRVGKVTLARTATLRRPYLGTCGHYRSRTGTAPEVLDTSQAHRPGLPAGTTVASLSIASPASTSARSLAVPSRECQAPSLRSMHPRLPVSR
jgi:hypothetical protein